MNTRAGWIPLFGLLLAGCASGGGGGMTVTAAAPPPTAEVYPNLDTINGVTLAAATGAALVNFNRQNTPTGTASATAATVNFAYSDPLKVYSVSANGVEQTFGNADLQASPSGYYFRTSTGAGGATLTNSLQISRDTFSYTGWGAWLNGSSNGGIENFDRFYFTYGIVTHAGDMPRSGTASYALNLHGITEGQGASVVGSGTLKADFTASTVGVSISPGLLERPGQTVATPLGTLTGSGAITPNSSLFSTTLAGGGYTGGANGGFYGPQAAEVGAAFHITDSNGNAIAGVMLGGKQ